MSEHGEQSDDDGTANRVAMGVALGVPVGVVLSLLLDNWGFVGVGIALGAAFGAIAAGRDQDHGDSGPEA